MDAPVVGLTGVVAEWTFFAELIDFPDAAALAADLLAMVPAVDTDLPIMDETMLVRVLINADMGLGGGYFVAGLWERGDAYSEDGEYHEYGYGFKECVFGEGKVCVPFDIRDGKENTHGYNGEDDELDHGDGVEDGYHATWFPIIVVREANTKGRPHHARCNN